MILISEEQETIQSQETIQYPCFKPEIVSRAHKDQYNWTIKMFRKFKFYPEITKIRVIKNDQLSINSRN